MNTPEEDTRNRSVVAFGSPVPESLPTEQHRGANYRLRQQIVQITLFDPSEIPVRDYPFFVPILPPDKAMLDFDAGATYNNGSMPEADQPTPVTSPDASTARPNVVHQEGNLTAPNVDSPELGGGVSPKITSLGLGFGNLRSVDPAPHLLTLEEGRAVQRGRARRIIGATIGRQPR